MNTTLIQRKVAEMDPAPKACMNFRVEVLSHGAWCYQQDSRSLAGAEKAINQLHKPRYNAETRIIEIIR